MPPGLVAPFGPFQATHTDERMSEHTLKAIRQPFTQDAQLAAHLRSRMPEHAGWRPACSSAEGFEWVKDNALEGVFPEEGTVKLAKEWPRCPPFCDPSARELSLLRLQSGG